MPDPDHQAEDALAEETDEEQGDEERDPPAPGDERVSVVGLVMGVVGAVCPVTNPVVTPMCTGMFALKAGNAVILRSGSESFLTSLVIANLLTEAVTASGLPASAIQLVPTVDRSAVDMGTPRALTVKQPTVRAARRH